MPISSACITCGALIPQGTSRCAKHTFKSTSNWAKHAQKHPERAAFYHSPSWRELRARHLAENPDCVICGAKATHVDHIVPLSAGGMPIAALQSLCAEHHRRKTQNESKEGNRRAAARRRQRG